MNKSITALSLSLAASLLAVPLSAKVSFKLDVEAVTEGATAISSSGLLVLVVDAEANGFSLPSAGNLVNDDDEVVTYWDLADYDFESSAIQLVTQEGGVDYGASWDENDPLALFWFPDLSKSNLAPAADTAYGVFADTSDLATGDTWSMPADGVLQHSLKFLTEAATVLVSAGDFPASFGATAYAVSNPPTSPTAPGAIVVNPNDSAMELSWTSGDASGGGFIVQRAVGGSNDFHTIGFADAAADGFVDDMISAGLTYAYRVFAGNGFKTAASPLPPAAEAERSVLASVAARSMMENSTPRRMYGQVDVIGNDPTKKVIIQASGPWLTGKIVGAPVQDPSMELYAHPNADFNDRVTVSTDLNDWMEQPNAVAIDEVQAEFGSSVHTRRVNVFDVDSKDASWLGDVTSGVANTFAVNTVDGSQGPVHIGIYNAEAEDTQFEPSDNRIAALATRGYLGDPVGHKMFGEFTIEGDVKKTVLIRGLGPNLANFPPLNDGNPDRAVVENPSITLYHHPDPINDISDRQEIAFNDDWESQVASDVVITDPELIELAESYVLDFDPRQVAFAPGSKDALLLVTLDPGVYTFLLNAPGTGIGLLGIYEVEIELGAN